MLTLQSPTPYNFTKSVRDHGWYQLAPFAWLEEQQILQRVERMESGRVVVLQLCEEGDNVLTIAVQADGELAPHEEDEIRHKAHWMLKFDEEMNEFKKIASADDAIGREILERTINAGRGRLLRSPTLWEDVVKTIATTNVTWGNTRSMIGRLVAELGTPFPSDPTLRAFPTPQQVVDADPALFDEVIRMGYRNAYVIQLANEIVDGTRNIEALRQSPLSEPELHKEILAIKGVGSYAANTLMILLGHYSGLPIDSEFRSFVKAKYFGGEQAVDKEMAAIYDQWGQWKALAYWFDAK